MVIRGEVWWARVPGDKRRPYLVLTRDGAIPVLSRVICVPTTKTMRGLDSEVDLDEDDGMPAACALSLDNIVTLPQAALEQRICALRPERMQAVCTALAHATGCAGAH
ncbi:MAG: type II toxin-antitoxin system PemK/MazF family toxin [Thermoleophilia bacterium]|nr:type II toxin-antitoxin system PemK/MazF family toxin [Thermoleophilia bacterium]